VPETGLIGAADGLEELSGRGLTAREFFAAAVEAGDPKRPFLHFAGATWSYEDVYRDSLRIAQALTSVGIGPGSRVVTMMSNTPEALTVIFGIAASGASYVPIIPESSADEVAYFLGDCQAQAALLDTASWNRVRDLVDQSSIEHRFLLGKPGEPSADRADDSGAPEYLQALAAAFEPVTEGLMPVAADDELCVMYTSGTTARPKGVVLTQETLAAAGHVFASCWECGPDDVILCVLPLFHVGAVFMCVAPAIAAQGGLMLQERFSVSSFWEDVDYSGATAGVLMPAMMAMLKTRSTGSRDNTLRVLLTHHLDAEFEQLYDTDTVTVWAMSESAGVGSVTVPGYGEKALPNLVGWPPHESVELRIVDDEGEPVPTGTVGEIVCRHPWTFREYLNQPEETARTIRDGWVFSGDLGRLDEQGRLFYVGRKKNMIKRSGENVSGLEVEQHIQKHPSVEICVCFGVPDPIRTEEVKVVVIPIPGEEIDEPEVVRWCSETLAAFKVPRFIEIRDELPRTSTAKPDLVRMKGEHPENPGWDRQAAAGE
jgi:crotonobetaine/carnitine-CoA ligase